MKNKAKFEPLAIVGMSCLFPKAQSLQDYWANIKEKVDCISEVPETSWKAEDYYNPDKKCPDHVYTKNGGFLNPVDFNPAEWGIAPTDLDSIDTSQLLSLVVAKGALADAGYANKDFDRDNTSVILGLTGTLELVVPLGARLGHPYWKKAMIHAGIDEKIANEVMDSIGKCYVGWQENSFPGLLGNCAAGRIANRLDLHGTNCVVDAACGSSLAALNMAAMELWTGKADMAITGGIDTFNDIFMFMCFCKTPALSPTGHARPFSADNDGTILGEGIGMVVIKRLSDAERDGDRIYACINAVGTSSDGKGKAVYAPSVPGQVKALKRAYEESGIDPKDIGMIEAHGTGTGAGDRVEVEALKEVYGISETNRPWCALGSVKSQIGHTKAAAGSANIIKAAMALYNKVIPPTIKVNQPADSLKDENLPFYLPNQIRPWVSDDGKTRHAALSSMGFGGSNYHVILTEYKSEKTEYDWERNVELITLSGSNASEIKTKLEGLKTAKEIRRFAAEARKSFKTSDNARLGFVIDASTDIEKIVTDISSKLDTCEDKDFALPNGATFSTLKETGKIGVLFPGQGSQYPGMGLDLTCASPEAFNALVEADKEIGKLDVAGNHLADYIYPIPTYNEEKDGQAPERLKSTDIAQPALGAVSIGMYKTLKDFGLEAAGFAGHSYGELVSLCAAGLFDSKALALISRKRGQLMGQGTGDRGGMIAVIAAREDVEKIMDEEKLDLVVANHNSNKQVVLSGKTSEIERSKNVFKAKKLRATVLNVAGAFHSKFVADAAKPFYEYLKEFNFGKLEYPVYANTTADVYPSKKEEARKLLGNQLANQVRFVEIIKKMYADGIRTFIEVGPGAVLSGLIKNILDTNDYKVVTMDSSKGKNSSVIDFGKALAQLSAFGYKLNIEKWQNGAEWLEKNPLSNKPKMNIPLVGANYKSKALLEHRAEIEKPPVRKLVDEKDVKVVVKEVVSDPQRPLQSAIAGRSTTIDGASMGMQPPQAPVQPQLNNTTIETLAALQIMQQETAELHKRFLEGQEMAQRALMAAISGQALPPMPPMGMPAVPPVPPMHQGAQVPPIPPMPMPPLGVHGVPPMPPLPPMPVVPPTTVASQIRTAPTKVGEVARSAERGLQTTSSVNAEKLKNTLIDVVAEKTGYPADMLNLDMDMEAELGIDSIKRVEIMSAIQERLPEAPVVQPDQLGKLRTLNQILEVITPATKIPLSANADIPLYERGSNTDSAHSSNLTSSNGVSSSDTPLVKGGLREVLDSNKLKSTLIEVVSEKTGYPADMLNLDMDMEAELGIDSIKRVEIMSAIQERLPEAPVVQPDQLGKLRTLNQILEVITPATAALQQPPLPTAVGSQPPQSLRDSSPASGGASSINADKLKSTLIEVVSEKTGYPADMLNLDMDMEAELGIDSIKRVEIMSAIQERLPEAPVVQPDQLGKLRTLNQILEVITPATKIPLSANADIPLYERGSNTDSAHSSNLTSSNGVSSSDTPLVKGGLREVLDSNKLKSTLIEVVSEKTGYPADMLNLDMDMEAELGIDSIKRVEIMSAIQERLPEAPVVQPDQLGKLRTLNQILEVITPATAALQQPPQSLRDSSPASGVASINAEEEDNAEDFELKRTIIKAVEIGKPNGIKLFNKGDKVVISNDDTELAESLSKKLAERNISAETLSLVDITAGKFPKELKGLVIIAPKPEKAALNLWEDTSVEWLKDAFMAIKEAGSALKANKGVLATVSRLDGNFGLASMTKNVDPVQGGLAGISKTTRYEWTDVTSKAIDLDYRLKENDAAAELLADEITISGPMETGLSKTSRIMIEEIEEARSENSDSPSAFQKGDTIIVTGGARGVTAETAIAFAKKFGTNMVLIGRSPLPEEEPAWLASLKQEAEIKRAIMMNCSGKKMTPKELGAAYKTAMANREVLRNIARLQKLGIKVKYYSASVLNEEQVAKVISEVRSEIGNISGIIHGAGVKRDKNIEDKTREQLDDVINTKVRGLKNVLKATVEDNLKAIVLFSSFSGRQGRTGQVDYAMANEVLNKVAQKLKVLRNDCHVMAFNWGPWDGGMVDSSLRKVFINEGIGLIPLKKGANCPIVELSNSNEGAVEIGIIGLIDGKEALSSSKKA